jgi:hypothetical protein
VLLDIAYYVIKEVEYFIFLILKVISIILKFALDLKLLAKKSSALLSKSKAELESFFKY